MKKINVAFAILMGCGLLVALFIFIRGEQKFNDIVASFTSKKIDGIITSSKKAENSSFYDIEIIESETGNKLQYHLPKSGFFRDNHIKVNDSVSKLANSKIMTFYQKENGLYIKCCDYVIGM